MEPVKIQSTNQQTITTDLLKESFDKNLIDVNTHESYNAFKNNIDYALHTILPENIEETKIQKARKILCEVGKDQTDEELQIFLTELQYFIDSWLDTYEQQIFEGLTLKELLRDK